MIDWSMSICSIGSVCFVKTSSSSKRWLPNAVFPTRKARPWASHTRLQVAIKIKWCPDIQTNPHRISISSKMIRKKWLAREHTLKCLDSNMEGVDRRRKIHSSIKGAIQILCHRPLPAQTTRIMFSINNTKDRKGMRHMGNKLKATSSMMIRDSMHRSHHVTKETHRTKIASTIKAKCARCLIKLRDRIQIWCLGTVVVNMRQSMTRMTAEIRSIRCMVLRVATRRNLQWIWEVSSNASRKFMKICPKCQRSKIWRTSISRT